MLSGLGGYTGAASGIGLANQYVPSEGPTCAPPPECINSALRDQEKAIAELTEYLSQLANRLQPILISRPTPSQKDQDKNGRAASQLFGEIKQNTASIGGLILAVRYLIDSIDL